MNATLTIDSIFCEAIEIESMDARKDYLNRVCEEDVELRKQLERLLQAHGRSGSILENPRQVLMPTIDQTAGTSPGTRIGPYLLREQIGEGGMGLVFVADQEHPVRRRVALKVVKPGMDSRLILARFEAERQALALMDHPNISKVLDAGATEVGRPYFVMELVRGVPITDYCDSARLTTRQRLELFLPICRAIQHAHQKGIIHRDIKPSNLLVTLYDSRPVPKVIDFGIAKAVGPAFADNMVYTGFAQLVGTPMYMSPEQAEMSAQDVDTRADVYALGVVLYELLTGTTPFDGVMLQLAGFDEMRRIIREDEPARPSQRVTTLSAKKQTTVTTQRGVDSRQLSRQLCGDLDWVVMTCLAKDRTRRYESVGALAADIERYLRDGAVEACPPSTSYRLRTFARRNRRMLAVAGIFVVVLVSATAVSMWQALKAGDAQKQAEAERDLVRDARAKADKHYTMAKSAVNEYLNQITDDEQLKHPNLQPVRTRLLTAAIPFYEQMATQKSDDPVGQVGRAEALSRIAGVWQEVGNYPQALKEYDRAMEAYAALISLHPEVAEYRYDLARILLRIGNCYSTIGTGGKARPLYERALALAEALTAEHPSDPGYRNLYAMCLLNTANGLPDESCIHRYWQALGIWEQLEREFPNEYEYREPQAKAYNNMACKYERIDPAEARKLHEAGIRVLERLAAGNPDSVKIQSRYAHGYTNAADTLSRLRSLTEELAHRERAVDITRPLLEKFPTSITLRDELGHRLNMLAAKLLECGRVEAALARFQENHAIQESLAAECPAVPQYQIALAGTECNVGLALTRLERAEDALNWFARADARLSVARKTTGRHVQAENYHKNVQTAWAQTLRNQGRHAESVGHYEQAVLLAPAAEKPQWRIQVANSRIHAGDLARGTAEAAEIAATNGVSPETIFQCAVVTTLAVGKTDQAALRETYAARAVVLFTQAVNAGLPPTKVTGILQDSALDPLWKREDFRALLDRLNREKQR